MNNIFEIKYRQLFFLNFCVCVCVCFLDSIISYARPNINISQVGNYDAGGARVSTTRTSRNAWVKRATSVVTEALFLRAADTLNLDEAILYTDKNAEDMQVCFSLFVKKIVLIIFMSGGKLPIGAKI